ncbi:hypothetical protein N692_04170 [Lactiplantibacillus plantarum EGD-AQ4]|nr:hypothetical protein N692_04170 [Lactiplantibacillus plantarum EGD-AQ4]
MTQAIVPALPIERARYEQAYVLGLETMTRVIQQLTSDCDANVGPDDRFPIFEVSYQITPTELTMAMMQARVDQLAIRPVRLNADSRQMTLRFQLLPPTGKAVWTPTAGALWRLYDGFLSNLRGMRLPATAIRVSLAASSHATAIVTPLRPSFRNYAIEGPTIVRYRRRMHPLPAQSRRATIYQLSHYLR